MDEPIGPDIDAYGTFARVEALADWIELAALAGRRVTGSSLADMISDNGWLTLSPQKFRLPSDQSEHAWPEDWADAVHMCLRSRELLLGEDWPFEFTGNWALRSRAKADTTVPYVAMLCLTVAHAWRVTTQKRPESVLEDTAVRALTGLGITASALGTAGGTTGGFSAVLMRAATALGIPFDPDAAPTSMSAKDEGVDTLAILGWPTDKRRGGQWLFLGQATVAASNEWQKKLSEPRRDHWRSRLMQPISPQRFLVVPHHVGAEHLSRLVSDDTGLIIDRMRLTLTLDDVSADESEILEKVLSVGVSDGRSAA